MAQNRPLLVQVGWSFSSSDSRASSSTVSIARRLASRTPATVLASSGVISPLAIAAITAPWAAVISSAVSTGGRSISMGRDLMVGKIRSKQSRIAAISPSLAFSMALRVMTSASPSSNSSAARVALLRAPLGLPFGLPLRPFLNFVSFAIPVSVLYFQAISFLSMPPPGRVPPIAPAPRPA
uniref:Uncharacterized protein n=1 Tax=uncultured marine microorganism HF4000_005I08 TaxID=455507 RepID=B3T0I7_9ZZZZ|nr:hypothetical protein ALOHA_HF4000005I08ctg1g23 [uncultured marine microorganism HF4000_005I08]